MNRQRRPLSASPSLDISTGCLAPMPTGCSSLAASPTRLSSMIHGAEGDNCKVSRDTDCAVLFSSLLCTRYLCFFAAKDFTICPHNRMGAPLRLIQGTM
jgi:hypothetical protein